MAALAPSANATLLVYFNFEDGTAGSFGSPPSTVDFASDVTGAPDNNPGGGIVLTNLTTNYPSGSYFSTSSLIPIGTDNQAPGDKDVPPATPSLALALVRSAANNNMYMQFAVDATLFTDMSLSLAINTNGNGFTTQMWQTNTGLNGAFVTFATFNGLNGEQILGPAALPTAANGDSNLIVRIVFSGGQSEGVDLQTIIDNIQLNGTVTPEPATAASGAFAILGLCWYRRRWLSRFLRLRRV